MKRRQQGVTILEVMVASVLLIIGLLGVLQLLYAGDITERRGEQKTTSALLASEVMEQLRAMPYAALTPTTVTNTVTVDGRRFTRTITITGVADAGYPTVDVLVQVSYADNLNTGSLSNPQVAEVHSVLSASPAELFTDGGP